MNSGRKEWIPAGIAPIRERVSEQFLLRRLSLSPAFFLVSYNMGDGAFRKVQTGKVEISMFRAQNVPFFISK